MKTPVTLIIMDGFGITQAGAGNAISLAKTPVLTALFGSSPRSLLSASGLDVGLPDGQMGNSEVGHTNIGAGRVVYQDLPKITKAVEDGTFFENAALRNAVQNCLDRGTNLHIFGLMSDGGVHSHYKHIHAIAELCRRMGLPAQAPTATPAGSGLSTDGAPRVFIHCFMDGRDTSPTSGLEFVRETAEVCKEKGAVVATVIGRYYAMDRDNRWERVERAYNALVLGEGKRASNAVEAIRESYDAGVTDEFIEPIIVDGFKPVAPNDSVVFMNFRPDRAREITRTFVDPDFNGFVRRNGYFPLTYVCATPYDATMPNVSVAFGKDELTNTFGEYVSRLGLKQLRIAETEKYAHVTFFFNGGVETVFEGEDRVLIPSPKVATYDLKPEMSAYEVTDAVVERIRSRVYDVIILNYANCDMVGHTGSIPAAIKAVETVDECVGRVVEEMKAVGGITLITADHGNADQMLEQDGSPFTAHTTNPVPFVLIGADVKLENGRLADIAPTLLDLMGLGKPEDMSGKSLIKC